MSGLAVILTLATVACYAGQNFFTKLYSEKFTGEASAATPVFAIFYGLIVGAATFIYNGFTLHPDTATLIMGLGNGLALFMYNISYIKSSQTGPYSFQVLMQSFGNLFIPLMLNITLWQESLKPFAIAGIIFMFGSLFLFNCKGLKFADAKKGYWLWVILLFVSNGAYSELIDAHHRTCGDELRQEMIIITYFTAAVIAAVYLLATKKTQFFPSFRMGKKSLIFMIIASLCAAAAINVLMFVLNYVSSTVLYPATAGLLMIVNAVLSAFVFHEKLKINHILAICCAVVSLVLLNL